VVLGVPADFDQPWLDADGLRDQCTYRRLPPVLFSPADMLRQPKNMPPVLADSTLICGKHGEASLARFYEQGWRLIQVLPNGSYTNPWIGIFERPKP
jgi:hypothetical protein